MNIKKRFNWLNSKSFDFYLPEYNIAIECQGIQHFKNTRVNWETVEIIQERDSVKFKKCSENNIKIIYYAEPKLKYLLPDNYFSKIFTDKTELIKAITNEQKFTNIKYD